MVKQKFKINLFDILAIIVLVSIICIGVLSYFNKPFLGEKDMLVEIKISNSDTINAILPKVVTSKTVYFSGTKYTVKQASYRIENSVNGQAQYLYITVEGLGTIFDDNPIFNGQRIYVNQKVEIRSDYQAQGYVVDFRYED